MGKKPPVKSVRRQERGQKRIDKLLDAAAKLFAEVGYEATTTNAIARAAKTSIGSLYQFFPNKEAVLHALAARYLQKLRSVQDAMMDEDAVHLPLPALYDRIIHSLADFHASHPGFQPLFYGSTTSVHLAAAADQLKQECIGRVDALMAAREPQIDPERRKLLAVLNIEIIKTLLPLAQAADPASRDRLLEEIKTLLVAHMREVLGTQARDERPSRKKIKNRSR